MKDFIMKKIDDLTSRSFIVMILSMALCSWLLVSENIDLNGFSFMFSVINSFNYGGSGLKGILDNIGQKNNTGGGVK